MVAASWKLDSVAQNNSNRFFVFTLLPQGRHGIN
jgi:hypothetical protein